MKRVQMSRYLSLILRHHPEVIGIELDEHGWADVDGLIQGIRAGKFPGFNREILEEIVRTDDKQRYAFDAMHQHIRANQGHSIPVDVELEEVIPPEILFHGTGEKYTESIDKQGLIHKSRLYVHLSGDRETAEKVGMRHGKPVIYVVKSGRMYRDGYRFFRSVNGVWLIDHVPVCYLEKQAENTASQ